MNKIEDLVNNTDSNTCTYKLQMFKKKFLLLRMRFCFIKKAKKRQRPNVQFGSQTP